MNLNNQPLRVEPTTPRKHKVSELGSADLKEHHPQSSILRGIVKNLGDFFIERNLIHWPLSELSLTLPAVLRCPAVTTSCQVLHQLCTLSLSGRVKAIDSGQY